MDGFSISDTASIYTQCGIIIIITWKSENQLKMSLILGPEPFPINMGTTKGSSPIVDQKCMTAISYSLPVIVANPPAAVRPMWTLTPAQEVQELYEQRPHD
jgi:hypothetical protein